MPDEVESRQLEVVCTEEELNLSRMQGRSAYRAYLALTNHFISGESWQSRV